VDNTPQAGLLFANLYRLSYCGRPNAVNPSVEGMAVDESDLIYSKHCQMMSRDGNTVRVEIYSSGKND